MDYDKATNEILSLAHSLHNSALKDAVNLHRGELAILGYLHNKKTSVSPSNLSELMCISTARVAASLNNLEKKGFIARNHSKQDRRKVNVTITPLGKKTFTNMRSEVQKSFRKIFDVLGEKDVNELIRILKRIHESGEI